MPLPARSGTYVLDGEGREVSKVLIMADEEGRIDRPDPNRTERDRSARAEQLTQAIGLAFDHHKRPDIL